MFRPVPSSTSAPLYLDLLDRQTNHSRWKLPSCRDTFNYRPVIQNCTVVFTPGPADKSCSLPSKIHPCLLPLLVHSHQELTILRIFVLYIGNSLRLYCSQQTGMHNKSIYLSSLITYAHPYVCGYLPPLTAFPRGFFAEACPRLACNTGSADPPARRRSARERPRRRDLRRDLRKIVPCETFGA